MDVTCGAACTVTIQIAPAPATADDLADIGTAFGLMLMVVLLVWGARQIYNVFNGGPHDGS